MKRQQKWFTMENLVYLFLMLSPLLDAASFLFHRYFPGFSFSPTTLLRPLIPLLLLLMIWKSQKEKRKELLAGAFFYLFYAVGHMACFVFVKTTSAYGSFLHEAQYVVNYTYMILMFYLLYQLYNAKKLPKLKQYLKYFLWEYVSLLYLALLSGTSSPTYIDGIGYKGWNASGNAVGAILLLSLCLLFPTMMKEKKKNSFFLLILTGIYLVMLLGTKVGLLGFPLVLVVYFLCTIFFQQGGNKTSAKKKWVTVACIVLVIAGLSIAFLNSSSFKRQQHLEEESNAVIDDKTKKPSTITGDALQYVRRIEKGQVAETEMHKAQQQALLDLYQTANHLQLSNSNRRVQQLLYHTYLVKEQLSVPLMLFGNGYLSNYSEMTLEMEVPAILYNFGFIGFLLFLGVFLVIDYRALKVFFTNFKEVDATFVFYLFGCLFAFALSFLSGYTFFHVSSMLLITILHLFLNEKRKEVIA